MSGFKLLQELKEPSVIWEENPDDPNDPEVLVQGLGRYRLSQLEDNIRGKIADLNKKVVAEADFYKKRPEYNNAQRWKTIQWMLKHDAMHAMIKTIISARTELEARKGVKESDELLEGYGDITIDGYTLTQTEDYEDDNVKIWHDVTDPSGKRGFLDHTPYEYITKEDFQHYVDYHKKHGEWPGRRQMSHGDANWSRDTLKQMNSRLGSRYIGKLNKHFGEEQEESTDTVEICIGYDDHCSVYRVPARLLRKLADADNVNDVNDLIVDEGTPVNYRGDPCNKGDIILDLTGGGMGDFIQQVRDYEGL